jgi:hypothetical protein
MPDDATPSAVVFSFAERFARGEFEERRQLLNA